MKCSSACMNCLASGQYKKIKKFQNEDIKIEYMRRIMERLGKITEKDTAPYLSYLFNNLFEETFNEKIDFTDINRDFNEFVLSMEDDIKKKIEESKDPLEKAIIYSRIGNYIDFGAMINVDKNEFLGLFDREDESLDRKYYNSFKTDLKNAKNLLILADNCGEIVLDKFLIEEIKKNYPKLEITVMIKGKEVLNDATRRDAVQIGLDKIAKIIDTGNAIAGSDPRFLGEEAKEKLYDADVILAKGQANFETVYGNGISAYYSFLCKCDYFSKKFGVKQFTGMFLKE